MASQKARQVLPSPRIEAIIRGMAASPSPLEAHKPDGIAQSTRKKVLKSAKRLAVWLLAIYALFLGAFAISYRYFLYPAPKRALAEEVPGALLLRFAASGSERVALFAPPQADQLTIVHFHGNGEEIFDAVPLLQHFVQRGFGFCAVEYPGYGLLSHQAPSEASLLQAAQDVLQHLYVRGVKSDRVVLVGYSLGTGIAAEMARRGHGSKLVLLAPYTSITDAMWRFVPVVPVRLLASDNFDTLAKVQAIHQPVLVVHGHRDGVVPFAMGARVAAALPRARMVAIDEAGHADLVLHDRTLSEVAAFVGAQVVHPSASDVDG